MSYYAVKDGSLQMAATNGEGIERGEPQNKVVINAIPCNGIETLVSRIDGSTRLRCHAKGTPR